MKRVFLLLLACCLLIAPAAAAGGSGTASDPYIIQTAAELQSMQNNLAAYYKLANNINNIQSVSFTPIGSQSTPFIGSFDGAGYTISNLVISSSTQSTGFFSCLGSGATIKDVTFADCTVSSTSPWTGTVIGSIIMSTANHDVATIDNVDCVRCSASANGNNVACLVGLIYTSAVVEITDCDVSYSEADSNSATGCLVGACSGGSSTEITRCNVLYSYALSRSNIVACFVGQCAVSSSLVIDSSTAQNSIAESPISDNVACLVGLCQITSSVNALNCDILNCLVKGTNYVGGIVGFSDTSENVVTAQTCTVTGCTIVATANYAGGIVGRCGSGTTSTFSGCSVTDSTIIASGYAAGICPAYS